MASYLLLAVNFSLWGQDSIPDFDYFINTNAWLNSSNAAGLNEFAGTQNSLATAYSQKTDGNFINYFESDNSYKYGFLTESYYKLNSKVTVYGKLDYSYFSGKNMSGSCFIDPYYNAFNIVEYSDSSTAGEKVKESYIIAGGFSSKAGRKLWVGVKAEYQNMSYFKTKDLRHTNDLMDLNLSTGLKYEIGDLDFGINYLYHRSVESVIFETYGNTDEQYYCLIDYGGFFGYVESFDESSTGFTRGSSEKPYFNQEHGASVQLNWLANSDLSVFNEFSLKTGDGYYGRKSSTTIVYTEHTSSSYAYKSIISLKNNQALHQLVLAANYTNVENTLNDPEESTDSETGSTIIGYGIAHKISNRKKTGVSLSYSGNFRIKNQNPLWHLNASINYNTSNLKSVYYEVLTYRKQQINQLTAGVSGYRNFRLNNNGYRISASIEFGTGSGYAFKDTYYTSTESNDDAVTMNNLAYIEYEYFTASRMNTQLAFRYSRPLKNKIHQVYCEMTYSATNAFDTKYVGNFRGSASLVLGYQF